METSPPFEWDGLDDIGKFYSSLEELASSSAHVYAF